jgi:hypothetical protein
LDIITCLNPSARLVLRNACISTRHMSLCSVCAQVDMHDGYVDATKVLQTHLYSRAAQRAGCVQSQFNKTLTIAFDTRICAQVDADDVQHVQCQSQHTSAPFCVYRAQTLPPRVCLSSSSALLEYLMCCCDRRLANLFKRANQSKGSLSTSA